MALKIISPIISPNGNFPNNPFFPLLIYKGVLIQTAPEKVLEDFEKNQWVRGWINGVYDFHHYHSNVHEVLGICAGTLAVQIGGEQGIVFELETYDVLILPAGVAHKKLESSADFVCVGAYAEDVQYDMNFGEENESKTAKERIQCVTLPKTDPVFGIKGPLFERWIQ